MRPQRLYDNRAAASALLLACSLLPGLCHSADADSSAPRFQLYISGAVLERTDTPPNSTKVQLMVYARNFGSASTAHDWTLTLNSGGKVHEAVPLPGGAPLWGRELAPLDRALEKTALSRGDGRVGYLYFVFQGLPEGALGGNTKETPDADLVLSMHDQAGKVWQTKVNLRALAGRSKSFPKAS